MVADNLGESQKCRVRCRGKSVFINSGWISLGWTTKHVPKTRIKGEKIILMKGGARSSISKMECAKAEIIIQGRFKIQIRCCCVGVAVY